MLCTILKSRCLQRFSQCFHVGSVIKNTFGNPFLLSFTLVALNQLRRESAEEEGTTIAQNATVLLTSMINCQIAILHNSILKHDRTRLIDRNFFVPKFGEEICETTARIYKNFLTSSHDIIP